MAREGAGPLEQPMATAHLCPSTPSSHVTLSFSSFPWITILLPNPKPGPFSLSYPDLWHKLTKRKAMHSEPLIVNLLSTPFIYLSLLLIVGFPGGSVVKNPPADTGDTGDVGLIPGLGRSLGGGNGKPLQYSCLKNPKDRGAWQITVHGFAKSQTRLSD